MSKFVMKNTQNYRKYSLGIMLGWTRQGGSESQHDTLKLMKG